MHIKFLQERSLLTRVILIVILLLFFLSLLQGALSNSLTFDEPSHIASGYAFLQQGGDGLWTVPLRGHPVLFNAWEALPTFIADATLPLMEMQGWGSDRRAFASEFIHAVQALPAVTFSARLPSILCTLLLAAVLWRVTTDIWGKTTGFLSLLILCFDPLLLAHGRLATNDVAATAFGSLYLFVTWRWGRKLTWIRSMILGVLLGMTMLSKATGIIYGAVGLTWSMWMVLRRRKTSSSHSTSLWLQVLVMSSVAFGMVWSAFGFSLGTTSALPNLPVPAPEYWAGTFFQAGNAVKREVFAFGYRKTGRWWWYFPFAFILKNPLPLLLTFSFSIFIFIKRLKALYRNRPKPVSSFKTQRFAGLILLLLFELIYICAALFVGPNIGYRHFLPVQPCLHLLVSGACSLTWPRLQKFGRLLLAGLGLWYVVGTLSIYPHEISFFNELVGGPDQGWRYLTTSNTDWLQGWNDLHTWQQENGIHFKYTGPEGYLGLKDYGINFEPLPPVRGSADTHLTPWLFPLPVCSALSPEDGL